MPNDKIDVTGDESLGFETMQAKDFTAPWLVILQGLSPQLQPGGPFYAPEAKLGHIFSVNSRQCYSSVHVIPVRFSSQWVEWKPNRTGFAGTYPISDPPSDMVTDPLNQLHKYRSSNMNDLVMTNYYLCMLQEEHWDRVIIKMEKTQMKKSKQWNTMMMARKREGVTMPIFSNIYKLSVVSESNTQGIWYSWKIEFDSEVKTLEMYNNAKITYQSQADFLPTQAIAYQPITGSNGEGEDPI